MGEKEEAEWVLDQLTKTLERELEAIRREELEMKSETHRKDVGNGREREARAVGRCWKKTKRDLRMHSNDTLCTLSKNKNATCS